MKNKHILAKTGGLLNHPHLGRLAKRCAGLIAFILEYPV